MPKYRMLDTNMRFELFPNGHPRFLTKSALRMLNAARRDAVRASDDSVAPYRLHFDEDAGNRQARMLESSSEATTARDMYDRLRDGARSGQLVDAPGQKWDWRSTRVHGLGEGVYGAGRDDSVLFRIRGLGGKRGGEGDDPAGGAGEPIDVCPDSVIEVALVRDEEEEGTRGSRGMRGRKSMRGGQANVAEHNSLLRDARVGQGSVMSLHVIDVLWGHKSLVHYLLGSEGHRNNSCAGENGYLLCVPVAGNPAL